MRDVMTRQQADILLDQIFKNAEANVFRQKSDRPFEIQSVTIDLSQTVTEANPREIKFPFKSFYVQDVTNNGVSGDGTGYFYFKPISKDSIQSAVKVKINDSMTNENQFSEAYLYWDVQANKTATIVFFVTSEFVSGSQLSISSGTVNTSPIVNGTTKEFYMTSGAGGTLASDTVDAVNGVLTIPSGYYFRGHFSYKIDSLTSAPNYGQYSGYVTRISNSNVVIEIPNSSTPNQGYGALSSAGNSGLIELYEGSYRFTIFSNGSTVVLMRGSWHGQIFKKTAG